MCQLLTSKENPSKEDTSNLETSAPARRFTVSTVVYRSFQPKKCFSSSLLPKIDIGTINSFYHIS